MQCGGRVKQGMRPLAASNHSRRCLMLHVGPDVALCPMERLMRRREFITLLGGAAAWPLNAHAQQGERMRRIGVLMNASSDDADGQARIVAFVQALQELGWTDRRNVRIDVRWGAGDAERYHRYAVELVALEPDVILAPTSGVVAALRRTTRTLPIVFTSVIDPVGAGFVANLARPG